MARVAPEVVGSEGTAGSVHAERGHERARIQKIRWARNVFFCLLLLGVTATRLTINTLTILNPDSVGRKFFYTDAWPIPLQVLDGFFRVLVGSLCFVPFILRFNEASRPSFLELFSILGCVLALIPACILEFMAFFATSEEHARKDFAFNGGLRMFLCHLSRLMSVGMLKFFQLYDLGWVASSYICTGGFIIAGFYHFAVVRYDLRSARALVSYTFQGFIVAIQASILLYEAHMKQRLLNKKTNKKLIKRASRGVLLLRLGAFLTLFDAIYLPLVENFGDEIGLIPAVFLTFDSILVLATILILGGILLPRGTLDPGAVFLELSHMGRAQGKRIAFPGVVNPHSQHCVVSFPGKYSEETWLLSCAIGAFN